MNLLTKIPKQTIKLILKIIYKIAVFYCSWFAYNFPYDGPAIDWDGLYDQWNDL